MTATDTQNIAIFTAELARFGGTMALERHAEVVVGSKNGDARDVVTNLDTTISALIIEKIKAKFPDHGIYSEESGIDTTDSDWLWSIDPIDGTSNYVRGLPHYSCVVTVLHKGEVTHSAIYAPVYNELYQLQDGVAYKNDERLQTTTVTELSAAYVNFHPGRKPEDNEWAGATVTSLLANARKSMNLGSSALDLCYVAAGKTDVVIYGTLSALDVAGAVAIVRAAGGEVYQYGTNTPVLFNQAPQKIIATNNPTLLADVYQFLQ